jgi:hypothetical protein
MTGLDRVKSNVERLRALVAKLGTKSQPSPAWPDGIQRVPRRLPWFAWLVVLAMFLITYAFMWCVVHVQVDVRPCLTQLPDPLFAVIPRDRRFFYITHDLYYVANTSAVALLVAYAWARDERPFVRWGAALSLQAVLRCSTMWLLPLCRVGVEPGTRAINSIPTIDLLGFNIPFRVWASNDLVFSGHVGEFLLFSLATRDWPVAIRRPFIFFQFVQAYALIASRGHYTIDLIVAVPCAFLADRGAVELLARLTRGRAATATATSPATA